MPQSRPNLPSVVGPDGVPKTTEQVPYVTLRPPPHLDVPTQRFLSQLQDQVATATAPGRHDPMLKKKILQGIVVDKFDAGQKYKTVKLRHGLGQAFSGYHQTRAYSSGPTPAQPFSAVEVPGNGGQDVTQWLVLQVTSIGTYDIMVFA